MREWLAVCVMTGLVPTAAAGELDRAYMRGSQITELDSTPAPRTALAYAMPTKGGGPVYKSGPFVPAPPQPSWSFEVGARYWYSTGAFAKDLFDDPRFSTDLVSRLTYRGLTTGTYEAFGRWDSVSGLLVKGFAGFGNLDKGRLNDEDFFGDPTFKSNTISQQRDGHLSYATVDIGQTFETSRGTSFSVFAGYGYLAEKANAFGCTQTAPNPFICIPTIPIDVLGITESTRWQFIRLGVLGEFRFTERVKLTTEAAWVPYVSMSGSDTHWLRIAPTLFSFSGPIPESGSGFGVQLEAILSYQLYDCFSLGIGGRYWNLQTRGSADLEAFIIGLPFPATPQPLNFQTERLGAFVQGSYKFNAL
jgi:hypothetical protein